MHLTVLLTLGCNTIPHLVIKLLITLEPVCGTLIIELLNILGYGIFTTSIIKKGQYILDYSGDLLQQYPQKSDTYVFEFKHKGKTYW